MPRTPRDVTEAELAVLRVLWDDGPQSVRGLADALGGHAATVQKLLERLEGKGWVGRDRSGPVQMFRATADRDDLIGRRLRGIAEALCEGSMTPLLSHLVSNEKLSPADRKALRNLIDRLDEGPKRKRG
jgi:BlaI family transcriptional regulator, penicillinase repressor